MDHDRQIEAELQRNFYLLACSPPKLLDRSHQNFTRYNGIHFCTSYRNLVIFGSVTPEFKT